MEEITNLVLPTIAIGIGATLQASVGYGHGLVAVPLLILINPDFIPAPFIFVSLILMLTVALRNKSALRGKNFNWIFLGLALGTPLGILLLKYFKGINFSVAVALIIMFGVTISSLKTKISVCPSSQGISGFISAIMGTVTGVGGAPIALLYQYGQGKEIRAILSLMFFAASLISFVGLVIAGLFQAKELILSLYLLPGILLGLWLGPHLAKYTDQGYSRLAILMLSLASAIAILVKNA